MAYLTKRATAVLCLAASFSPVCAQAGTVIFSDNFSPPSAQWSNSTGNWTASGGKYYAQTPNNAPFALTYLPYVFTNISNQFTVTVNNLGDGGFLFEAPGGSNYLLSIVGGEGYGQGQRGGNAGSAAYWATYSNPSAIIHPANGVFAPGNTYTLTATVKNGTFTLYNDPDGKFDANSVALTFYVDPGLTSFKIGFYDDQPNTATGSGFGPPQSFSNFSITGTTSGVPEPSTWVMMFLGFGGLGVSGYWRMRKSLASA